MLYTDVAGMTPSVTAAATSTSSQVAGLSNDVAYYFAVTTVNLSGGESTAVTTISATPIPDRVGPVVAVTVNGGPLNNATVTQAATIAVSAADPSGISRVVYKLDNQLVYMDTSGQMPSNWLWDIYQTTNGAHTLTITVFDSLDNPTVQIFNVNVALAAPAAPAISSPQNTILNQTSIAVAGTAPLHSEVLLYNNGAVIGAPVVVGAQGGFTSIAVLNSGANVLSATARNRGGESVHSASVTVTVDTTIPLAPSGLTASSYKNGHVLLNWNASGDANVTGYNTYRSASPFSTITSATKVNTNLLTGSSFDDLPATDAAYYYSVVAVKVLSATASTPSTISNQVSAVSDRTAPTASITYIPHGAYDAATGRMAPGFVDALVTVSEALLTDPFFSITPNLGVPMSIALTKVNATSYSGSFEIKAGTPSGTAYAVFSGRDVIGNRGTQVTAGATVEIDTLGPVVRNIIVTPAAPIKNTQATPADIKVEFELSEPVLGTTALSYQLSASSTPTLISGLYTIGANKWVGTFTLPANAGLAAVETMSFVFQGSDDLGNLSTLIEGNNAFEVYQGNLPSLTTPQNVVAESLSVGAIHLTWNPVDGATAYQVYRQAPGEIALTSFARLGALTSWTDTPAVDGSYIYAVASVRQHNGQESESTLSTHVTAISDATLPAAPTNLVLTLLGSGIEATWNAPIGSTEPLTYNLYRSAATSISSVSGLVAVKKAVAALSVIDGTPSATEHAYVVTAVDAVGNESVPSASVYLNFSLLPVVNLKVTQLNLNAPSISWSHASAASFDIHLGINKSALKLNQGLLTAASFIDGGFNNDERYYTVVAIDANGAKSLGRTIRLPQLSATLAVGSSIKRGIMNELVYHVINHSTTAVSDVHLEVKVGTHNHRTPNFALAAGATKAVTVIVGGFADLANLSPLSTTIDMTTATSEQSQLIRTAEIAVLDAAMVLDVQSENLTRGATGRVRFSLRNTSAVETEIITAINNGKAASPDIHLKLLDVDGNVVSVQSFTQSLGVGIRTLADGRSVATIAPGAVFTSNWMNMPIPANAADTMRLQLVLDALRYHVGKVDETTIPGMNTSQQVILVDTAYYCAVDSITPASSFGAPIVISGRAIDRITSSALANVPLKLVMNVKGFEKVNNVFTDGLGAFNYTYTPRAGENGVYNLSCIHPDVLNRPDHGSFTLKQISVTPTQVRINVPKNYPQVIPVNINTSAFTTASNVRLVFDAINQPTAQLPVGVKVTLPMAVTVQPNSQAILNVGISADNSAAANSTMIFKVYADEFGVTPLATISMDAFFSEAKPALFFSPSFIETGVTLGSSISEIITLENRGLASMHNVQVSILNQDGTPAPAWVNLTSASNLGTMAVGDKPVVSLAISPSATEVQGNYSFNVHITSSNHPPRDIAVYATVTASGQGDVLFKASDIFTATLDANGNPIQGLAGASIRLQNEKVLSIDRTLATDVYGEAMFTGLPAGQYKFRATAASHQEVAGRLWVKPGMTVPQDIFLDYNLVSVSWTVNQVTIKDKYQVNLNLIYQTNVPAAVVVIEPAGINLPTMLPGDVFSGEFTMTNHGLIRADNVVFTLPVSNQYFKYEFLLDAVPTTLDAKQVVTVPYRVTMLSAPGQTASGIATGGGCWNNTGSVQVAYEYWCVSGIPTHGSSSYMLYYSDSSSCGGGNTGGGGISPAPGGGSAFFGGGGGYGSGGGGGYIPSYQGLSGLPICMPDCPDGKCGSEGNSSGGGR